MFAAAFAFLALRLAGPITVKRLAVAGMAGIALVLAFIGIDEASGGHSHVTRAFEKGPGAGSATSATACTSPSTS